MIIHRVVYDSQGTDRIFFSRSLPHLVPLKLHLELEDFQQDENGKVPKRIGDVGRVSW